MWICREDFGIERNQSPKRKDGNAQFSLCCTSTKNAGFDSKIDIRHFLFQQKQMNQEAKNAGKKFDFPSTLNHQLSTFNGGIAQLVERQLCKLEVRGSNPLASKACKAWRQQAQSRKHYRMHERERNPLASNSISDLTNR
jgi:hypothetical protein